MSVVPDLSVIVPVLNEEHNLSRLLPKLFSQLDISLEVLVADGGSTDGSRRVAGQFGARVVVSLPGRGRQMNRAAAQARGTFLLFLHADSEVQSPNLLARAVHALRHAVDRSGHDRIAGHFPLLFKRTRSGNRLAYRYIEEKTSFNRVNTTNGDQGFLLTRRFFQDVGPFAESLPFLEDQRLAEAIRSHGEWITLPGPLVTSARRFEVEGFHRRYILMGIIMGLFSTGADDFFRRAPQVYRSQDETGRLLLTPFFKVIRRMMAEDMGIAGSVRAWLAVGRYIRSNSWQMFYFLDVLFRPVLGSNRYPWLWLHDRLIGPLISWWLFDGLVALLAFIWFMGVLAPWFWWTERCRDH